MTFLDLFAGIGGFRRGMEMAGHKCVGFCEFDRFAAASYISMHLITDEQRKYLETLDLKKRQKEILKDEYRNGEWYATDIRDVNAGNIPRADCYCFGAPCQDFSVAGRRAGLEGDRSSLVREVFRIIGDLEEEDRPEWLIYENVKGMLSSNRGFDFLAIILEMDRWGYDIQWQLLNSKRHGVPQNRERVYLIGHLRGRGTTKIFPIEGTDSEDNLQRVDINQVAQCFGNEKEPNPCAGRVYDEDGLMRSLGAANGMKEPFVSTDVDVKTIAHRKSYYNNTVVVDPHGVARTLDTAAGGGRQLHTIEVIGNTDLGHEQNGRIYDSEGISPCLNGIGNGGNHEPKVATKVSDDTPIKMAKYPSGNQKSDIFSVGGISRTLAATDYKQPVSVIQELSLSEIQTHLVKG